MPPPDHPLPQSVELSDRDFQRIREYIHREAGIALSDAKRTLVASRLASRLRELGIDSYGRYFDLATGDPAGAERTQFINALTTNKTDFYREAHHFEFLRKDFFPELVERAARHAPRKLRIWCAASSTGEEPWTLAMTVADYFADKPGWDLKILASDIDTDVLAAAQAGEYSDRTVAPIPAEQRLRWFTKGTGDKAGWWLVRPELKRLVKFRQINLIAPQWPIHTRFDAIFCRNVVIYFDRETQAQLYRRFAQMIEPHGVLVLGHSESLHWMPELWKPSRGTLYRPAGSAVEPRPAPAAVAYEDEPELAAPPPRLAPPPKPKPVALPRHSITIGGVFASRDACTVRTLLGSCIAACLYDPVAKVGGMNHFLLPGGNDEGLPTRFGIHAMETLINEIMKIGGDRRRFVAKVFGASHVLDSGDAVARIPQMNADFILKFMETEAIPVASQKLRGTRPLEVIFEPHTGKALVREVGAATHELVSTEQNFRQKVLTETTVPAADITLF